MKKKLVAGLATGLLLLGFAGFTSANTLTDTTYFDANGTTATEDYVGHGYGSVNKLDGIFDYVTWEHQFTFDPAADVINSATLALSLRDDNDRDWLIFNLELGFGFGEDLSWDFGEVDTGVYSYNIGVSSLYDGAYRVTLASLGGDFYIDKSELTIDYTPTPEPATMLLFGTGLAGLAGVARRKKK